MLAGFSKVKRNLLVGVGITFLASMSVGRTNAQINFHVGPGVIQPTENILVDTDDSGNAVGPWHVFGHTNTTNTAVTFTNPFEKLRAPSSGQARVEAFDNLGWQFLCLNLTDPTKGFTELEFNLNVFKPARGQASGHVFIDVFGVGPGLPATGPLPLSNIISSAGQNFFSLDADPGTMITKVQITTDVDVLDGRQFRIDGIGNLPTPPPVVPEASSLAMLSLGGLPVLSIILRRRKNFKA
jgi:hypothetical protein